MSKKRKSHPLFFWGLIGVLSAVGILVVTPLILMEGRRFGGTHLEKAGRVRIPATCDSRRLNSVRRLHGRAGEAVVLQRTTLSSGLFYYAHAPN